MKRIQSILIIVALALAVASPLPAESSRVVQVPVSGTYFEPALGSLVSYEGILHHVWTPLTDGSGWSLASVLAARTWIGGAGTPVHVIGVASQRVVGPSGTVELAGPIVISEASGAGRLQGSLAFGVELPKLAAVPAPRATVTSTALAVAGSSALSAAPVMIPVKGEFNDPAVGGEVGYEGIVTLNWTPPPAGTDAWTVKGTLVAQAAVKGSGEEFTCLGYCENCFIMNSGSTVEMTKPIWAIGVGRTGGFTGTIRMVLELPLGAALPTVKTVTLASR